MSLVPHVIYTFEEPKKSFLGYASLEQSRTPIAYLAIYLDYAVVLESFRCLA